MRKVAVIPLLLVALGLAACGGGSNSSSGSGTGTDASGGPETAWAKEVDTVMRRFENHVSARAVEQIHTTSAQVLLEPIYRSYGAALTKLAGQLAATDAPPACAALRERMATDGRALGRLTGELGHERQANEEEFASLVVVQETRLHHYGRDLTEITADPGC